MGKVTLPVQFRTPEHFRVEYITFIVADFNGTYHTILGRPSLAKFMAIPHYVYLLLKMLTERGVLTLRGSIQAAYNCETESYAVAEASDLSLRI